MSQIKASVGVGVLQLRAEPALLQEIKDRARRRHISANRLVVEAVTTALQTEREREREEEWRTGFEAMGQDPDVNSVEYALPAAREVLLGD